MLHKVERSGAAKNDFYHAAVAYSTADYDTHHVT